MQINSFYFNKKEEILQGSGVNTLKVRINLKELTIDKPTDMEN